MWDMFDFWKMFFSLRFIKSECLTLNTCFTALWIGFSEMICKLVIICVVFFKQKWWLNLSIIKWHIIIGDEILLLIGALQLTFNNIFVWVVFFLIFLFKLSDIHKIVMIFRLIEVIVRFWLLIGLILKYRI